MADRTVYKTSGIGLGTVIFIVLLILKLAGVIELSWLWVILIPLFVPLALWLGIILIIFLIGIIALMAGKR